MGVVAGSRVATYRVLREFGARAQRTFAAVRQPHELVVIHRFTREGRPAVEGAQSLPADRLALVLRDAQCLAKNWHPNVARVKYVDLADGDLTIATELVDGATLADLSSIVARRGATFPLDVFVRILLDVLAGVHAIHGLRDGMNKPIGAVHGALCPANIVVGRDGVARVINVLRPRPPRVAAGSEGVGYAPPEMLDGGAVDARADVYAAGVLLWEALTGRRLHDESDPVKVLAHQREADVPRPELPPGSPYAPLVDVAMRALSFDPALRFRTAADMATQLRRLPPKLIASGSVVAARVMELDGERIRGRRAALDPSSSGSHRRPSSGSIQAATAAAAAFNPRGPNPKVVPPVRTIDRVVPVSSSDLVEEPSSGVHASAPEASEPSPPTVRRPPEASEPAPPTVRRPPPLPARPAPRPVVATAPTSDDGGSAAEGSTSAPALRAESPSPVEPPPVRADPPASSPAIESVSHLRVATPAASPPLVEPPVTHAGSGPLPALEPAPIERPRRRLLLAVAELLVLACALSAVVVGFRSLARTATSRERPAAVTTAATAEPAASVAPTERSSEPAPAAAPAPRSKGEVAEPAPSAMEEAAPREAKPRPEASSTPSPTPKKRYDPLGI
jgi:serine/threonine-protein kinase